MASIHMKGLVKRFGDVAVIPSLDLEIRDEEFVRLGKKHNVVTMNDCAADVPPVENLWKFTAMGFDLVVFSGGKGIRGPQSAGLLLGRKDLIAAARAVLDNVLDDQPHPIEWFDPNSPH